MPPWSLQGERLERCKRGAREMREEEIREREAREMYREGRKKIKIDEALIYGFHMS